LITLLVYIKHNTSPLIINRGVFVIPLPVMTPIPPPLMSVRVSPLPSSRVYMSKWGDNPLCNVFIKKFQKKFLGKIPVNINEG